MPPGASRTRTRGRLLPGALPRAPAAFALAGSSDGRDRCAVCGKVIVGSIRQPVALTNWEHEGAAGNDVFEAGHGVRTAVGQVDTMAMENIEGDVDPRDVTASGGRSIRIHRG